MDKLTEGNLKSNPVLWANWEYQHDSAYWIDRQKNGSGLIQQIANFVIKQGAAAGAGRG